MDNLHDRLLAAHDRDDRQALVGLYREAADAAATLDAECFFLTHAYIYALELNHANAPDLHARLVAHGREA